MALNKFMHPRNIYRTPPDFKLLAEKYKEFSDITKVDVLGKICIDFKDPKSLRVLTKYLLKSDFNLEVHIPEDRLVPTLPLRLNYVLWIEDILTHINRNKEIIGVDIGTGACAVYPLLIVKKYQWKMIGTESDKDSFEIAAQNVKRNDLDTFIELKYNVESTLIGHLFSEANSSSIYDFCMCNPPFYSSVQELYESRSIARPPPKNAFTGSPQELITKGGELEFIRKLIAESKAYHDRIRIFTTMVGHKYNLKVLVQDLKNDGITYCETEFCQGRVTRWGLAWTFGEYDLSVLDTSNTKIVKKKSPPIIFPIPISEDTVDNVAKKIKLILESLTISYKVVYRKTKLVVIEFTAKKNTWANQRRKRRMMIKTENGDSKKIKGESSNEDIKDCDVTDGGPTSINQSKTITENVNVKTEISDNNNLINGEKGTEDSQNRTVSDNINSSDKSDIPEATRPSTESNDILVKANVKVLKKVNNIFLEMDYVDGISGKEGLHQIMQYIKNIWK